MKEYLDIMNKLALIGILLFILFFTSCDLSIEDSNQLNIPSNSENTSSYKETLSPIYLQDFYIVKTQNSYVAYLTYINPNSFPVWGERPLKSTDLTYIGEYENLDSQSLLFCYEKGIHTIKIENVLNCDLICSVNSVYYSRTLSDDVYVHSDQSNSLTYTMDNYFYSVNFSWCNVKKDTGISSLPNGYLIYRIWHSEDKLIKQGAYIEDDFVLDKGENYTFAPYPDFIVTNKGRIANQPNIQILYCFIQ